MTKRAVTFFVVTWIILASVGLWLLPITQLPGYVIGLIMAYGSVLGLEFIEGRV